MGEDVRWRGETLGCPKYAGEDVHWKGEILGCRRYLCIMCWVIQLHVSWDYYFFVLVGGGVVFTVPVMVCVLHAVSSRKNRTTLITRMC